MSLAYQRGANLVSRLSSLNLPSGVLQFLPCAGLATVSGSASFPFRLDAPRGSQRPLCARLGLRPNCGVRGFQTSTADLASKDYYEVLGVSKNATDAELKKAYYKVAKQYHPDANKGDATAATKFQDASRAYETLKDPQKRALYDQVGAEGMENGAGFNPFGGARQEGEMNPEDIFKMFFGGGKMGFYEDPVSSGKVGHDLQANLTLTFVEAAKGCRKTINLGRYGGDVEVNVPAGMFGEQVLTMRGKGAPARNKEGRPGNLLVGFSISPHPSFRRHGFDVHVDRSIDFVDAALGTQTRVETIDGPVEVNIRPGAQNNDTLRIGGKGIGKELQGLPGRRGDQIVHLRVTFPRNLSKRQKELLEEFRREDQAGNEKQYAA